MLLTPSFAPPLKASPAVVSERQEQKTPPSDTRPVKPQTPQGPAPPTRTTRQQRPSSLASGPQPKADRNSTTAAVKVSSNGPTPASSRSQTVVSSSVATNAITKDAAEFCPVQEIPSGSSTSGMSPRRNDRIKKKKVRWVCYLACVDILTEHHINRFRKRRIQQLR